MFTSYLSVFLILWLILCVGFLIRNNKVFKFRMYLCSLCSEYEYRRIDKDIFNSEYTAFEWFLNKHSYSKMLFSFYPLKLEYWYTEEKIKKINN